MPKIWEFAEYNLYVDMPKYFPYTPTEEISDMHLIHDNIQNASIGFFLLNSGELKTFYIESNLTFNDNSNKSEKVVNK